MARSRRSGQCVCVSVYLFVRTSPCSLAPSPQAKVGDLKAYLKAHKQPQAGEKEDLVARVTLHVQSRSLKIDGRDPFDLKPAELRKACAQRGLNPMGERDELLKLLIDAEGGGGGGGGGSGGGGAPGDDEATTLVKQVRDTYWKERECTRRRRARAYARHLRLRANDPGR